MKTKSKTWQRNLDLLTATQLSKYDDSLEVLRLVRHGTSFSKATKTVGISSTTAKKFLGSSLRKKENRIVAKQNDSLIRQLRIYENGKEHFIQVRGSKTAKRIAQYHSSIGRVIDGKEPNALKAFEWDFILDTKRKSHHFETDIKKILAILEKREEPEFFTIYRSS
ncbi:MAG: hypothetical protein FJ356_00700 [Thaumarchaeota archaeon]|nr:hypothetical protein [Nitrososphaerota archaeon]